jgi:hypothetical protein
MEEDILKPRLLAVKREKQGLLLEAKMNNGSLT